MGGRSDSNGLACISPDPNLIENLWDLQSTHIEASQPEPQAVIDFRDHLTQYGDSAVLCYLGWSPMLPFCLEKKKHKKKL